MEFSVTKLWNWHLVPNRFAVKTEVVEQVIISYVKNQLRNIVSKNKLRTLSVVNIYLEMRVDIGP
jgi:hypothetical protein